MPHAMCDNMCMEKECVAHFCFNIGAQKEIYRSESCCRLIVFSYLFRIFSHEYEMHQGVSMRMLLRLVNPMSVDSFCYAALFHTARYLSPAYIRCVIMGIMLLRSCHVHVEDKEDVDDDGPCARVHCRMLSVGTCSYCRRTPHTKRNIAFFSSSWFLPYFNVVAACWLLCHSFIV